ncbi:hypothetical protein [Vibrio variabilis]|uniref:hypothetical protein n=1 Tax=Vibrio variabilis TaxID=990271 RepID=UPI000DD5D131|nr:hypothetical protein [Vibrio variabilis]
MKKYLLLALLLPGIAAAHSQSPSKIKKYVGTDRTSVQISLTNTDAKARGFEIIVDEKVLGEVYLKPDENKKLNLNLKIDERDQWVHKIVSTRSIPQKGESVRTEIQSKVSLHRPTLKSEKS